MRTIIPQTPPGPLMENRRFWSKRRPDGHWVTNPRSLVLAEWDDIGSDVIVCSRSIPREATNG